MTRIHGACSNGYFKIYQKLWDLITCGKGVCWTSAQKPNNHLFR